MCRTTTFAVIKMCKEIEIPVSFPLKNSIQAFSLYCWFSWVKDKRMGWWTSTSLFAARNYSHKLEIYGSRMPPQNIVVCTKPEKPLPFNVHLMFSGLEAHWMSCIHFLCGFSSRWGMTAKRLMWGYLNTEIKIWARIRAGTQARNFNRFVRNWTEAKKKSNNNVIGSRKFFWPCEFWNTNQTFAKHAKPSKYGSGEPMEKPWKSRGHFFVYYRAMITFINFMIRQKNKVVPSTGSEVRWLFRTFKTTSKKFLPSQKTWLL